MFFHFIKRNTRATKFSLVCIENFSLWKKAGRFKSASTIQVLLFLRNPGFCFVPITTLFNYSPPRCPEKEIYCHLKLLKVQLEHFNFLKCKIQNFYAVLSIMTIFLVKNTMIRDINVLYHFKHNLSCIYVDFYAFALPKIQHRKQKITEIRFRLWTAILQ